MSSPANGVRELILDGVDIIDIDKTLSMTYFHQ